MSDETGKRRDRLVSAQGRTAPIDAWLAANCHAAPARPVKIPRLPPGRPRTVRRDDSSKDRSRG